MSKRSTQNRDNQRVRRRDLIELIVESLATQFREIRLQIQEVHDLIEIIAREMARLATSEK